MGTAVDLDTEILAVVKDLAVEREKSLGRVVSSLIRQGLQPHREAGTHSAFSIPVLPRKPDAKPVTSQRIKDLRELGKLKPCRHCWTSMV